MRLNAEIPADVLPPVALRLETDGAGEEKNQEKE